ncbi:phosphoribulokinase/uridine kinase [Phlyctochytrium arcticum]|nr:phosphoribulokinase/uridine kinase [Phlyctochytrium arcticum]
MNNTYNELATYLLEQVQRRSDRNRLLVAIAGIPGSGKSTLALEVARIINAQDPEEPAQVVSMDGFHLFKKELDAFEDPVAAHARRGAAHTFRPSGLLELVQKIKDDVISDIPIPSFDHAVGDPIEGDTSITPKHRIILIEGLYLHLDEPIWLEVYELCDERWFINIDLQRAKERVAIRHVRTGLAPNLEAGQERWRSNDGLNADFILQKRLPATQEIFSIEND